MALTVDNGYTHVLTNRDRRSIARRVARGAQLLDQYVPKWHRQIDVSELEMNNGGMCILGQTFGDFSDGLHELLMGAISAEFKAKVPALRLEYGDDLRETIRSAVEDGLTNVRLDAAHYGFDTVEGSNLSEQLEYDYLATRWLAEIDKRS